MEKFSSEDISTITNAMNGKQPEQPQPGPAVNQDPVNKDQPAPEPGKKADPAGAAPAPPVAPEPFDLKKIGFNTPDELQDRLNKIPVYEKELAQLNEYKAGPKFKSDRHKFLYEVGERAEGMELSAVRQLLDVVELLEQKDVPDQRIRFEAFRLKPENKGLSQEEIGSLFEAEELERYGNPQDTVNPPTDIQKIRAKQATAQAKESLAKIKSDWEATRPVHKTPTELAMEKQEYIQFLQTQLTGFDGIPQIKLQATDSKGEKLAGEINFKIDATKQLPIVANAIADPQGWWDAQLEKLGIMVPGKEVPDFKKWGELVAWFEFRDDLLNQAYQQGLSDHEAHRIKTARNVSDPNSGSSSAADPATPVNEKKEANQQAMKVAGLR